MQPSKNHYGNHYQHPDLLTSKQRDKAHYNNQGYVE